MSSLPATAKSLQQNLDFAKEIYGYEVIHTNSGVFLFHSGLDDVYSNQFIQLTNDPLDFLVVKKEFLLRKKQVSVVIPSFIIFQPIEILKANNLQIFEKEVCMTYNNLVEKTEFKLKDNIAVITDLDGVVFKEIFEKVYSKPISKENPYGEIDFGYLKLIDYSYKPHKAYYKIENFLILLNQTPVACVSLASSRSGSYIYSLATLPEFRNQGLGTSAINYCIKTWQEQKLNSNLYLITTQNSHLEKFYTKLNFRTMFSQDIYREVNP